MISGRATITLAGKDNTINLTPPIVIDQLESSPKIDFLKAKILILLLDSSIGSVEINIGISNKEEGLA